MSCKGSVTIAGGLALLAGWATGCGASFDVDDGGDSVARVDAARADANAPDAVLIPACTNGSAQIIDGGSCYESFTGAATMAVWVVARNACRALGGDLVKITSDAENTVVMGILGSAAMWIGANDIVAEGNFVWSVDNTSIGYDNWRGSTMEPNNGSDATPPDPQNCAAILGNSVVDTYGLWADRLCETVGGYGYVCERPAGAI